MPDPTKQSLSATETPALFGVSKYVTPWMLYQRFAKGAEPEQKEDSRMKAGKMLQAYFLALAAEALHFDVVPNDDDTYVRRGLLGCTRDAIIINPDLGPVALETKGVFEYRIWMERWSGGDAPPREYELQLQQQMYVGDGETSFKGGIIAAWCGGEQVYFERQPMPDLWEQFELQAADFFEMVALKREPDPMGLPIEVPLLTKLYPPQKDNVLDWSGFNPDDPSQQADYEKALKLAEDVRLMKWHAEQRLGHEKAEKDIKARLQAVAPEHDKLLLPHRISADFKKVSRKGYEVQPSTYVTVTGYVPKDLPEGKFNGF